MTPNHKPIKLLVLTYWSYKEALIQSYTLPYLKQIHKVAASGSEIYLVTLEKEHLRLNQAENKQISVELAFFGITLKSASYNKFGLGAIFMATSIIFSLYKLILKQKIDYIHCWCTPAGALGFILSMLTNKPLILDSYEPHAEAMVENGEWRRSSIAFKLLFWLERLQSKKASCIISATEGMKDYSRTKYGKLAHSNWHVKPACVNLTLFQPHSSTRAAIRTELELEGKICCVYAGKFGGIYLDKEVFQFFKVAFDHWGSQLAVLLLTPHSTDEINQWATGAGLPKEIIHTLFLPHKSIPDYLSAADFAITPVKPVPTKRYCTPIKNGEYWAMGLPVIIPKGISDDSDIIEENDIGYVVKELSDSEFQNAVNHIDYLLQQDRTQLAERIRSIGQNFRDYSIAEGIYQKIYGTGNSLNQYLTKRN